MTINQLPALNALLNGTAAVLLATGYAFIKSGRVLYHRICMVTAFCVSSAFLVSYLTFHYHAGNVPFRGQGWTRPVYFSILISHTLLAIATVPLVLRTLYLAVNSRFEEHRRIARWTFPTWMYVSVTGVIVYWLLFRLYPAAAL